MNRNLENVIRQALADARGAGRDTLSQTEHAIRAIHRVRPDINAPEALAKVNRVQRP